MVKTVSRETWALREIMTKSDLHAPLNQGIAGVGPASYTNWSALVANDFLKQLDTSVELG